MSVKFTINFKAILEKIRKMKADLCDKEGALRLMQNLGIHVYLGKAKFKSDTEVTVNDQTLNFYKCCIATGQSSSTPLVEGIDEIDYFTPESIFNLTA